MDKFLEVLPLIIALVEKLLGPKTGPRKLGLATIIARDSLLYLAHDGSVSQSDAHDIGRITHLIQSKVAEGTPSVVEPAEQERQQIEATAEALDVQLKQVSSEVKLSMAEIIQSYSRS